MGVLCVVILKNIKKYKQLINFVKPFYTCFFMGGLGNQMFQAANVISKAKKNNVDFIFRKSSYTPLQGFGPKKYENNIFKNLNFDDNIKPKIKLNEASWAYSNLELPLNNSIEFHGYFQSSKNFTEHQNEIRNLFYIDDSTKENLFKKYEKLNSTETVCVHVRRGDYLKFPNIHPCISMDYILHCLGIIKNYSKIYIVTDDKLWCKEHINFPNCQIIDEEDYIELWILSLCPNLILSNSSFSWWGGFLNKNKNKQIFVPSLWFGPNGPSNFVDIYEDYHKIINVEISNNSLVYAS